MEHSALPPIGFIHCSNVVNVNSEGEFHPVPHTQIHQQPPSNTTHQHTVNTALNSLPQTNNKAHTQPTSGKAKKTKRKQTKSFRKKWRKQLEDEAKGNTEEQEADFNRRDQTWRREKQRLWEEGFYVLQENRATNGPRTPLLVQTNEPTTCKTNDKGTNLDSSNTIQSLVPAPNSSSSDTDSTKGGIQQSKLPFKQAKSKKLMQA